MSEPDWKNFAKAVLADWPTGDLEGSVLFDLALEYGMIKEVPGGYNSDHHIDADSICPEEGDPWYEYTFRGEAGPGLYSISALTAERDETLNQLDSARHSVDVLEKRVAGLMSKLAEAQLIAGIALHAQKQLEVDLTAANARIEALTAKLAKAVEAFEKIDALTDQLAKEVEAFEKLARLGNGDRYGNSDGNMIARAALAEIEGEKT